MKNKGQFAIENKIKNMASKFDIEKIEISSRTVKDATIFVIISDGVKKEVVFTKDEIEEANKGHFLSSTLKKINEVFENPNLNIQPGGGGPVQ